MAAFLTCFQGLKKTLRKTIDFEGIFRYFQSTLGEMIGRVGKLFRRNGNDDLQNELYYRLKDARLEYPAGSHQFFVPVTDKTTIITREAIAREIYASRPTLGRAEAQVYANEVHSQAVNLFAVLAYLKKGREISVFWEEGISDRDLPFQRASKTGPVRNIKLTLKNGRQIRALDGWKASEVEKLSQKQWWMTAPIFENKMEHRKFDWNTVLPFTPIEESGSDSIIKVGGGYSEMFFACIHTAHHKFQDNWEPGDECHGIAIKRLYNYDEAEFDKERRILKTLGQGRDASPHLVKLLATYEYQEKYHFIFPKADCNLRDYWTKRPQEAVTATSVQWSLNQMAGIAKALEIVHNFKLAVPLEVQSRTSAGRAELRVQEGEDLYGRHGDIKPENVIWFQQIPEKEFRKTADAVAREGGVLQITDFGLGRFHGRDSKTEKYPNGVFGSPTYEPPECRLHQPVSRRYDIWGLGCLYLEFATWLVMGPEDIEKFADHRGRPSSIDPRLNEDYFYTVVRNEASEESAIVREGVTEWAQKLHEHAKCSKFIHDLVDLIMEKLLIIDARKRIETSVLCSHFDQFLDRAKRDKTYLWKPSPPN